MQIITQTKHTNVTNNVVYEIICMQKKDIDFNYDAKGIGREEVDEEGEEGRYLFIQKNGRDELFIWRLR